MTVGRWSLSSVRYIYKLPNKKYSYTCGTKSLLYQSDFIPLTVLQSNRIAQKSQTFASLTANMAASNSKNVKPQKTNRLALEKSPYLLQHATNPVDWYPWCTEALEKAKKEDKLIFLSVGYSTCHWCHVMEKESFTNKEIADIMNKHFVNIKVDNGERPDIDKIYMAFVQATTGHGGWPMSVFLTPDLKPVFGGTYFPPEDTFRQTGFKTILLNIADKWNSLKTKITEVGSANFKTLKDISKVPQTSKKHEVPSLECSNVCALQLASEFEPEFGGFTSSFDMHTPKFPQPVIFNFLFHMYARHPNEELAKSCLHMCVYTLKKIAFGGIHDHIGQGFSRYATDGKWHVPHFEKMLYDQGQLMKSYADAYVTTKDNYFAEIVDDIAAYVIRDLRHQEGGFYSAEDADSYATSDAHEKLEGAFYVWTAAEIKSLLDKKVSSENIKLSDIFCHHFNVKESGNVKGYQDPRGELTGKNVLIVYEDIDDTAKHFNCTVEEIKNYLKDACSILYEARQARPRPHLDDKIITSWNGLMISGLAYGGAVVDNKQYIEYATDAAKFIKRYLFDEAKDILLHSCYRNAENKITQINEPIHGFLDDYAFVIKGLLDLYEAGFDEQWLEFAERLQDIQDKLLWDETSGGYFTTTSDDPSIIVRLKEAHDGAEPSGNSISAENLLRLAYYLGRSDLKDKVVRLFGAFRHLLTQRPIAVPQLVSALVRYHDDATQIYVVGKRGAKDTDDLLRVIYKRLIPGRILMLIDHDEADSILLGKNERLRNMKPLNDQATVYVCKYRTCSLPVSNSKQLEKLLDEQR
nr:PREDICTED: spermatogenesis-associated protein 20 isoform X2 [Megachile rotundata]XP_012145313.1 PREDICTED: spermatogenesis-associated protein 20 isoform X2 [Megachile rotundata]XP_012145314.1 PREDICTED: spermatogenesis-associated protein 20 isoform X2 [Megachile rotundata]XP_012145315.1 PREDICTED: spermatogenesis-associated protein 20 isoform X2 [Megachile rotundata]XP_012145316.1 PREDICTED: spermatogenesis-associated protein 20 isoform X2 [Megachile rotundata]